MGAGRKTQPFIINGSAPASISSSLFARNLGKNHLGGVIFGCTNTTMKECLSKQLFGLPAQHFSYVKNIDPGLPLFLFNYSDRKLYGIFESASPGQMNINPYGWTSDGSEKTQYPAQVQVRVRLQCQPLIESQFKPIIYDNYYNNHHFWFELDHAQTRKLMSSLASLAVAPGAPVPQCKIKLRTGSQAFPSHDMREEGEGYVSLALDYTRYVASSLNGNNQLLEAELDMKTVHQEEKDVIYNKLKELALKCNLNSKCQELSPSGDVEDATRMNNLLLEEKSLNGNNQLLEAELDMKTVHQEEKDVIYNKLKELALKCNLNSKCQELSPSGDVEDATKMNNLLLEEKSYQEKPMLDDVENTTVSNDLFFEDKGYPGEQVGLDDNNGQTPYPSSEYPPIIAQLVQEVTELKIFKTEQTQKIIHLEQKLVQAEMEIQRLKGRLMLEPESDPSTVTVNEDVIELFDEPSLDPNESIFLFGGYTGESWLSALDSYYPSHDVIKSLSPMNSVRSYASVAQLNGDLYIIGGGNGNLWYNTVESYCPANDQWTQRPSLSQNKGSLAAASANNKIFAMGGGNGIECFSVVEMLDLDVGRWISTRSMMQKRFALAAVELNGVLYAAGGFDGSDYLKSVERFDPREHTWTKIASMTTRRGSHSLVALNEKLYAIGGFDGSTTVSSVEIFDPRLGLWMTGEPMIRPRGYSGAAVVGESIYVIAGVRGGGDNIDDNIEDTVEIYKEGQGWRDIKSKSIGKRGFFSAIALSL